MLEIKSVRSEIFGPLSLSIKPGQCIAIMGKSGSGKSLFLRAIADLDPNEGEISLNAKSRDAMPASEWRRMVGLVPAESGWWADSVGDHFDNMAGVAKMLAELDLPPEILSWQVARLSTGERQRLALIRALTLQPVALMLDEPTAALDRQATACVESLIQQQLAKGVSIILITHDEHQAARLADETYLLENGKLVKTSPEHKETSA